MARVIPTQLRAVDPYASYHSNIVNRLTRAVSNNQNIILRPDHLTVTMVNDHVVEVSTGIAIMDDVLIHVTASTQLDLTDPNVFYGPNHFSSSGYYYVILDYQYNKVKPAPEAGLAIVAPADVPTLFNPNEHLFLAALHVDSTPSITDVYTYDPSNPSNQREISPLSGIEKLATLPTWDASWEGKIIYVEDVNKFYAADDTHWIDLFSPDVSGDNISSTGQPAGKIIVSDGSGGSEWKDGIISFRQQFATASATWTINHNLDTTDIIVQFFDDSSPPKQIIPLNVEITSSNTITATFSKAVAGRAIIIGVFA